MNTDNSSNSTTVEVELSVFNQTVKGEISVSNEAIHPKRMLPVFQTLADTLIQLTANAAAETGVKISCQKGCAACCRKLIPISKIEAVRIAELIESLPETKSSEVFARFIAARKKLQDLGLLDALLNSENLTGEEVISLGTEYFKHWITCPFLEEESCLIYENRPVACREYLVASPPENCFPDSPTTEDVLRLNLPSSVSTALASINENPFEERAKWIPLIVAPDWAESHSNEIKDRPGVKLLEEFLKQLDKTRIV